MKYELAECPACGGRYAAPSSCQPCYGTGRLTPAAAEVVGSRIEGYKKLAPASAPEPAAPADEEWLR